jgi:hypothetical protein
VTSVRDDVLLFQERIVPRVAQYALPKARRPYDRAGKEHSVTQKYIEIRGARENNLKR